MPITAEALMRQLESDPEWVARRDEREALATKKREAMLLAQQPILQDLRAVGVSCKRLNLSDIEQDATVFRTAACLLLKHLQKPYSDAVRESIARCLETKQAKPFFDLIVDSYIREPRFNEGRESGTKEALGAAVGVTADSKRLAVIVKLLRDPTHGPSRVLLLKPLRRRFKRADVRELIVEFMDDPGLVKEIMSWKKKLVPHN